MSAFQSTLDLATVTTPRGIRLAGTAANEWAGWSLASAGDINGDGVADVIIGASLQGASGRTGPGSAYVVFGRADGWANIDLANLTAIGFRIGGIAAASSFEQQGLPVSSAGDVNGDGFDDLIVGSLLADTNGRANNGTATILYGHAGGFADVDISQPLGSVGSRIDGAAGGDYAGRAVAELGDFNGDGYDDVVVGTQYFTSFGPTGTRGSAFVLLGSAAGIPSVDLASPGANVFRIDGAAGDNIGRVVASAGDLNGDGLADLVTSGLVLPTGNPPMATATVIFGRSAGLGTLNLANLGSGGFRITGIVGYDSGVLDAGLASAGDFNGDGYTDLIVGAPGASNNGRTASGSAYVIYGKAGGFSDIDLSNPGSYGFRIDGAAQYNHTGYSVAGVGDVNGDGYADIAVGGFNAGYNSRFNSGSASIILGRAGGSSNIDLANPGSNDYRFDGAASGDRTGKVAAAGDVDGDGFADVLIGAYTADPLGRTDAGAAYLLFSQSQSGATLRGTTMADTLRGTPDSDTLNGYGRDDRIYGNAGNDTLIGGDGNDTLDGGPGTDMMTGGPGDDTYVIDQATDSVVEQANEGNDTVFVSATGPVTIGPNVEIIRLIGAATSFTGSATAEQIVANAALATTLSGGAGDDTLWGSALNNTLQGGDGDDIIRGQSGGGTWSGGQGNDQFVVGNAAVTIVENPNEGIDTVWVTVDDYTLAANIEILRLAGTAFRVNGSAGAEQLVANPLFASVVDGRGGDDVIWGNNLASTLNGGSGDDIIRPQFGVSTLYGGAGNDQFVIQNNNQVIIEAAGEGDDTAWVAVNGYAVGANVERINLSGLANTAIGNDSDNIIAGNPLMGNEYLVGGAGSDIIFGSTFADTFRGDAGNDTLYSLGGADRFVYQGPGWGYDAINGFTQGAAKLVFTGSGITFGQLSIVSGTGNSQVEYGGSAILVFGVANLTASDFLF